MTRIALEILYVDVTIAKHIIRLLEVTGQRQPIVVSNHQPHLHQQHSLVHVMVFLQHAGPVVQTPSHVPQEKVIVIRTHIVLEIWCVEGTIVKEITHLLEVTGQEKQIVVQV